MTIAREDYIRRKTTNRPRGCGRLVAKRRGTNEPDVMLLDLLVQRKHGAQVALKLVELMRRVAQHAPTKHDSAVVLLQIRKIADGSHVPTANPHAALDLDRNLQGWPCKVESPSTFGVEAILAFGRGQAELAGNGRDLGEGH